MKKRAILKSLLILLPILAVGLATTGDSVLVFDVHSGVTEYYPYFDLIPDTGLQMLPPLAAMLSLVAGICGAVYLVKKKDWSLKVIFWASLAAACAASVPTVMQGDLKMVPNVGLPLFMVINWLVASYIQKHPEKKEEKKPARRLKK